MGRIQTWRFDLPETDMMCLAATYDMQTLPKNLMIPHLTTNLQKDGVDGDLLSSAFAKTVDTIRQEVLAEGIVFRTNMRYKLCLSKIFKTDVNYRSSVELSAAQEFMR